MLVPRALQVRDTETADPRLAALMARAPKASRPGGSSGSSNSSGSGDDGDAGAAWQFKMALQLIAYRLEGERGSHHPYIRHLPGVAPGVPPPRVAMRLQPAALMELQHPQLAADAGGQAHFCAEFARDVLAALPGSQHDDPFGGEVVTEELLAWGLSLAMSRSFGFRRVRFGGRRLRVGTGLRGRGSDVLVVNAEEGARLVAAARRVGSCRQARGQQWRPHLGLAHAMQSQISDPFCVATAVPRPRNGAARGRELTRACSIGWLHVGKAKAC
jgi:hypothetical protein